MVDKEKSKSLLCGLRSEGDLSKVKEHLSEDLRCARTLIRASFGIVASLALAYTVFVFGMKINMRKFFYFTSMLLVLLAGGLAGYGVHELVEYSEDTVVELGWLGGHAYILDIPRDNPLHHKGIVGSIPAVMFGYTTKAEWARVIVHLTYLTIALPLTVWVYKKTDGGIRRVRETRNSTRNNFRKIDKIDSDNNRVGVVIK